MRFSGMNDIATETSCLSYLISKWRHASCAREMAAKRRFCSIIMSSTCLQYRINDAIVIQCIAWTLSGFWKSVLIRISVLTKGFISKYFALSCLSILHELCRIWNLTMICTFPQGLRIFPMAIYHNMNNTMVQLLQVQMIFRFLIILKASREQ